MHPLLSSQTPLLLAIGVCAYLGLLHLGYVRRWRDPHLWVALWACVAVAFQTGRLIQISTLDPELAVGAARFYAAMGPLSIACVCAFARSISRRPTGIVQALGFAAANLAFAAAIAKTSWFLPSDAEIVRDWFGREYFGMTGRLPVLAIPAYLLAAGVFVVRDLARSPELSSLERGVLYASLAVYAASGLATALSSVEWAPVPGLAEYGPVALGAGLSFLLVHRRRRLETELQSLVEARTAELAASEARYRGLIDNAPIGIFACDPLGRITTRNPRLLEILGEPLDAAQTSGNVLTHPPGIAAGVADTVSQCLTRGEVVVDEHRYTSSWGRTADVRLVVAPIRSAQGTVTGALGLVEDITQRRALEEGLRRSQKLESVGQLAAGIAHEINNPMAFVRTNLAVLREEWHALRKDLRDVQAPDRLATRFGECESLIDESLEGIERTIAIARDMREFAHTGGDGRAEIDLNQVLEACVRVANPHRQGATRVEEHYGELPPVWASAGQLSQVFVNLLVNALQAVGQVGTVRVETLQDGDHVVAAVSDDGSGIAPEHRDRLFDPFFTTKAAGEGTGLGLYVSHEIVRGHGGEIVVISAAGEGARFEVRLPIGASQVRRETG